MRDPLGFRASLPSTDDGVVWLGTQGVAGKPFDVVGARNSTRADAT